MTRLSLIWAQDEQGLIGRGNALPWHMPADMQWFRRHTLGKPVLMGRRTYASIGRPLPGRTNLVLSRSRMPIAGCRVVASLDEALASVAEAPELMVIGGAQLYALALARATRLYQTVIHARFDGDVYFPAFDRSSWRVIECATHAADARNAWPCTFTILERGRG